MCQTAICKIAKEHTCLKEETASTLDEVFWKLNMDEE